MKSLRIIGLIAALSLGGNVMAELPGDTGQSVMQPDIWKRMTSALTKENAQRVYGAVVNATQRGFEKLCGVIKKYPGVSASVVMGACVISLCVCGYKFIEIKKYLSQHKQFRNDINETYSVFDKKDKEEYKKNILKLIKRVKDVGNNKELIKKLEDKKKEIEEQMSLPGPFSPEYNCNLDEFEQDITAKVKQLENQKQLENDKKDDKKDEKKEIKKTELDNKKKPKEDAKPVDVKQEKIEKEKLLAQQEKEKQKKIDEQKRNNNNDVKKDGMEKVSDNVVKSNDVNVQPKKNDEKKEDFPDLQTDDEKKKQ